MAYKQVQGRSEFSKTGRGITSNLAGPGDPQALKNIQSRFTTPKSARVTPPPPPGDVSMPSTKKINYTGGQSAKKYNTYLKDSLASQNLPTGNYSQRFHNARSIVKSAARQGNISKDKASSMSQDLHNAEFDTHSLYTPSYTTRGGQFIKSYEGNRYRDEGENRAERILMSIEKQDKTNSKNLSQKKK